MSAFTVAANNLMSAFASAIAEINAGAGTASLTPVQSAAIAILPDQASIVAANAIISGFSTPPVIPPINGNPAAFNGSSTGSLSLAGSNTPLLITTVGNPTPAIAESGTLPGGITFADLGTGTATLSGTPTAAGTFPLTFTATNSLGTNTLAFTLTVS